MYECWYHWFPNNFFSDTNTVSFPANHLVAISISTSQLPSICGGGGGGWRLGLMTLNCDHNCIRNQAKLNLVRVDATLYSSLFRGNQNLFLPHIVHCMYHKNLVHKNFSMKFIRDVIDTNYYPYQCKNCFWNENVMVNNGVRMSYNYSYTCYISVNSVS